METGNRRFWVFLSLIIVSSALIAWSLVSLYRPLGYEDEYLEEDYEPEDEIIDEEPLSISTRPEPSRKAAPKEIR